MVQEAVPVGVLSPPRQGMDSEANYANSARLHS
jgi:hypothetical protein